MRYKLSQFNLSGFADSCLNYLNENEIPLEAIVEVLDDGKLVEDPDEDRNIVAELQAGKRLFLDFCGPNVGDPMPAADGEEYEWNPGDEDDEDYEVVEHAFGMGDTDVVGFLVKVEGDEVQIDPAIHFLGGCMPPWPPSVEVLSDPDIFREPMERFVQGFVRK